MGDSTIPAASDGTIIPASNHNSIRNALSVDVTPRNASGVVVDQAGSIGSSTYTWLGSYIQNIYALTKLWIGAVAKNNTLETDGSDDILIKRNNTTKAKITSDGLEREYISPVGQQISSGCGNWSSSSTSFTDITNLSVTITTTGRPVFIALVGDGTAVSLWNSQNLGTNRTDSELKILRDAVTVSTHQIRVHMAGAPVGTAEAQVPASIIAIDLPTAGTYTYKAQARVVTSTSSPLVIINYTKLVAFEIA